VWWDKVQDGGQAPGLGKQNGQNQKTGTLEKTGARVKKLLGLINKTNWQQTEHRYKYTGANEGRHLGGGDKHKDT
jgi:hypothetical protein